MKRVIVTCQDEVMILVGLSEPTQRMRQIIIR